MLRECGWRCGWLGCLSGCGGPKSGSGFTLPEGDARHGEALFQELWCNSCHAIAGRPDLREGVEPQMTVMLGGQTPRISTYGELVTSIINPSHEIAPHYRNREFMEAGRSRMMIYNEIMTVSELSDLVTFIQQQYELEPDTPTQYHQYGD